MLTFFDYVYYKASDFYSKSDPNGAGISGLVVISLLQFLNVLSAYLLVCILSEQKPQLNKLYCLALLVFLLIVDGIRYNKRNYPVLKEKWGDEVRSKKTRNQLFVLAYIFCSFVLTLTLVILVSEKPW